MTKLDCLLSVHTEGMEWRLSHVREVGGGDGIGEVPFRALTEQDRGTTIQQDWENGNRGPV